MALPMLLAGTSLGLSAISAGASLFGGLSQADALRARAREEARRLRLEHERTISETAALGGEASGITSDSASLTTYLEAMTKEFKRQEDWTLKAGLSEAGAVGRAAPFNFAADLGGALFQFGAANNWFKTPSVK